MRLGLLFLASLFLAASELAIAAKDLYKVLLHFFAVRNQEDYSN
jgi:hypothetical protein